MNDPRRTFDSSHRRSASFRFVLDLMLLVLALFVGPSYAWAQADTTPPSVPTGLTASLVGPVSLKLSWTASTDNVGVTQYQVFRGATSVGTTSTASILITGLSCSTVCNLTVRARDAAGNWSAVSLPLQVITTPSLAAGGTHGLAVKLDGSVLAWGGNSYGQLGDGTTTTRTNPVAVSGLTGTVAQVAAGANHSLALMSDGTVWAWGANNNCQLGNGATSGTSATSPVQVKTVSGAMLTGIVAIAAHGDSSAAVKSDGTVWAWGGAGSASASSQGFTGAVSVALGSTPDYPGYPAVLVLKNDGTVWWSGLNEWGSYDYDPDTDTYSWSGAYVYVAQVTGLSGIVALSAGDAYQLAAKSDGSVWSWGYDQTSIGTASQLYGASGVVALASSNRARLAQTSDGRVWMLGVGEVSGLAGATALATGTNFSLGAKSDGTVWTLNGSSLTQVNGLSVGDATPPSVPTNLAASFVGPVSLSLSWTPSTDNVGVTQYQVFRGTTSVGTTTTPSILVTGLSASTSYSLTVRAGDASGNWSQVSTPLTVMTAPSIAAGGSHSLAVKLDGSVWAWGGNSYGQLGDGTTTTRVSPVAVSGLTGTMAQVAAGTNHSLALKNDGTVWAWGANNNYQLGNGATSGTSATSPVQMKTVSGTMLTGIVAIAAHGDSSAAVKSDGSVWACGFSGSASASTQGFTGAVSVALGSTPGYPGYPAMLVLKNDGTVWWSGYNQWGSYDYDPDTDTYSWSGAYVYVAQVTGLSGIVALAAGDAYQLALKSDGTVWSWGYDQTSLSAASQLSGLSGIVAISGGNPNFLPMALKSDGTLWTAFGGTPAQVTGLTGVTALATGGNFSLAAKSDGTVWTRTTPSSPTQVSGLSVGDATPPSVPTNLAASFVGPASLMLSWAASTDNVGVTQYQVFRGATSVGTTTTPSILVTGLSASTSYSLTVRAGDASGNWSQVSTPLLVMTGPSIAAGGSHSLTVKPDGSVWAWGNNTYGQLGDGTTTNRTSPTAVSGLTGTVTQVAAGTNHSVALKSDGTVWAWGDNSSYQLGDQTTTSRLSPAQVKVYGGAPLTGVTAVAAAFNGNLAVRNDGTFWAWGGLWNSQASYQLGGVANVVAVAVGRSGSALGGCGLALEKDGTVWQFGWTDYYSNDYDPDTDTYSWSSGFRGFVQVSGLTGIVAITGGDNYQLALKSDGTVWTWHDQASPLTATQVSGLSNVVALAGGSPYSLPTALKSDGTMWTAAGGTPAQVTSLTAVTALATGGNFSLAAKSDGTIWAWGQNGSGQLGDGTTTNRTTPVIANGTASGDTTAPTAPTNLVATNVTSTSLTLSWTAATDNVAVTGYEVFRDNTSLGTTTGVSMNITGLNALTYGVNLSVRARDAAGNWSSATTISVSFSDTTPPTAPPAFNYANLTATEITLFWGSSTDNIAVVGYNVYRGGTLIGTTSSRVFTDAGLTAGGNYTYTVKAFDAVPNYSTASTALNVTTPASSSQDSNGDGVPDAVATALGLSGAASADTTNQTQQNIHRPTP